MTTEKMNVHKALAELKILDDRIVKAINSVEACISNKHSNTKSQRCRYQSLHRGYEIFL